MCTRKGGNTFHGQQAVSTAETQHFQSSLENSCIMNLESESRSVVSDSLRPHGLCISWNSPDQNTGVGIPFSRRSSQSRDQTWVSHIAGRIFTSRTTREALMNLSWEEIWAPGYLIPASLGQCCDSDFVNWTHGTRPDSPGIWHKIDWAMSGHHAGGNNHSCKEELWFPGLIHSIRDFDTRCSEAHS